MLTYDEIYIATIGNLKSWWTPVNGPVPVPEGFAESTVSVPRPDGTLLYIKPRDDPSVANPAALPVVPEQP